MLRLAGRLTVCAFIAAHAAFVAAQDDVADVPSVKRQAGGDEKKQYFLIGAPQEKPADGAKLGLIVVLPGGDGSAEFHPFVKRIFKHAVPEGFVLAQPIAVKWTLRQQIVWPTAKVKAASMKFSTEEFLKAVIDDVETQLPLDPNRIFTLSWSSGGPAACAAALDSPRITGSLVAMSVFKPSELPPLKAAAGRAFFIYHSPDDRVCPYRMAEQAEKQLRENGAEATLKTYAGGHGWVGPVYNDIREGIDWLTEHAKAPATP